MIYFIVVTVLLFILCFVLFIVFLRAYNKFLKRKWTKVLQYFVPTLLALMLFALSVWGLAPRVFDLIDIARGHYDVHTVQVASLEFPQVLVTPDGNRYSYSALEGRPESGKIYQLSLAPRTKFVVQFLLIER